MSVGKSRQKTTSSGKSGPDAATQAKVDEIFGAARAAGGQMPTQIGGAQDYYGGATAAGRTGIDALSGNADAAAKFMNPYQLQVLDQMTKQFGVQNQMTERQMNDAATRAGAFGGSRHGVATGVALGENQRNQAAQYAGLLNSGFEGAMGRAGQVAGMGFDAAGAGATLGAQYGSPDLWRMEALRRGFSGMPYGQTYSGRGNTTGYTAGYSIPGQR